MPCWDVLPRIVLLGIQNTDSLSWFCEVSYAFRCSGFSEFWGGENCLIVIQKSNIIRNINLNARVLGNVAFFSGCTYKQVRGYSGLSSYQIWMGLLKFLTYKADRLFSKNCLSKINSICVYDLYRMLVFKNLYLKRPSMEWAVIASRG